MGNCFAAIDIGSNAVRLLIKKENEEENLVSKRLTKAMMLRVPLRLGFDVFALNEVSEVKAERLHAVDESLSPADEDIRGDPLPCVCHFGHARCQKR